MMKMLITGGTGFIGNHLSDSLICDIIIIEKMSGGTNLKSKLRKESTNLLSGFGKNTRLDD